ncbi:MAG: TatD-related deoxyribonuclease [Candidatus Micrarchaeum acidiphilum ARMAN-2]|uniref:TatD-related deoxyribonuclease n=1 Tax=Candidatus Micrarchaeum acidiphilum ARMAN-2 TaxID=425595 RepID=C7DI18_MICA2|nr:MAG: TatD-related deoxyribonuclease [Candidatus Micrarchaeum acidiphilum ARMAN-2]
MCLQQTRQLMTHINRMELRKTVTVMADAHCHLDAIDILKINEAVEDGVLYMFTDGVDTKSNLKSIDLASKHVFPLVGVHPEYAAAMSDKELNYNLDIARSNKSVIVGIGEIGLDYTRAAGFEGMDRQKQVFELFLDLAEKLKMPVSVHSRNAIDDVFIILKERTDLKVHIHFFEGGVEHAKIAERRGYMISVPPLKSAKRDKVINSISIDYLMAETDSPTAGMFPKDVRSAVENIARLKQVSFETAAEKLTQNTIEFFNVKDRI